MTQHLPDALLEALQCPYCQGQAFHVHSETVVCDTCLLIFPIIQGVVNTLVRPSEAVIRELEGMMAESAQTFASHADFIVQEVPYVTTLEERKARTRGQPFDYYGSTEQNFRQALRYIPFSGNERVLEIGGHSDYPFLVPFRERGCLCFETNIVTFFDATGRFRDWPLKVAGDMNRLPYRDDHFDIVLLSATTHHSPDLDTTIREIARVTRPGGAILLLNEPTHGLFKHLTDFLYRDGRFRKGSGRDALVHENEYSIRRYRALFRKHGLVLKQSLFSAYYEEKLARAETRGVRFALLGGLVGRLWRFGPLREALKTRGLWLGQTLLGLQMNVIVEKPNRGNGTLSP